MTKPAIGEAEKIIEELMQLHPKGFDLSLDRISRLLENLGNPQNRMPPVIHVAGTNGKGSVTAFCRALLEAAGLSVHVHTSPHLVNWHERYRIGVAGDKGRYVEDEIFADALRRIETANAAAAIRAVKAAGFEVTERMIEKAMTTVEWPGRLQRIMSGKIAEMAPKDAEIWVDGGHNPGAGEVIAEAMAGFEEKMARPLFIIAGMINTKDPVGYFKAFADIAEYVFTVPIGGTDAAIDPVVLAHAAFDAGLVAAPTSSLTHALEELTRRFNPEGPAPRILIGGSLYLAGNALALNGTVPQ